RLMTGPSREWSPQIALPRHAAERRSLLFRWTWQSPPARNHTPTSPELRQSLGLVQKVHEAAALTAPVSVLIFPVRSTKCCANAHGLSSDRLFAQDRLPDARRLAKARADDSGALEGDGSLSPAARDLARAGKIRPA